MENKSKHKAQQCASIMPLLRQPENRTLFCLMLGRLQSGKFVVLLLVFVEEAADSQQHECCDNKVVDRLCDTICTLTSDTIKSITRRSWIINFFN